MTGLEFGHDVYVSVDGGKPQRLGTLTEVEDVNGEMRLTVREHPADVAAVLATIVSDASSGPVADGG